MQLMTLREICNVTKVSRRAVQGYEKAQLVKAVSKNDRGHLLYDEKGKEKIILIKTFQNMGFSIKEIQHITSVQEEVKVILENRIEILKMEGRQIDNIIKVAEEIIQQL